LNARYFVKNIKSAVCPIPLGSFEKSAALVGNTTAIGEVIERISEMFDAMYRRKAFLHWYIEEGEFLIVYVMLSKVK
jgi:tubulin beta